MQKSYACGFRKKRIHLRQKKLRKFKSNIFSIFNLMRFRIKAKHKNGFGIHSPFLWKLWRDCIGVSGHYYAQAKLEKSLSATDCRTAKLFPKKYHELTFRLINYFDPKIIIFAGAEFSAAPLYMAAAKAEATIFAAESTMQAAKVLEQCSRRANIRNISLISPNKDKTLRDLLSSVEKIDMVYFNTSASASRLPEYYEMFKSKADNDSVFIFEKPRHTKQSAEFWNSVQKDSDISLSLDLYGIGIVFFKKELSKQHFLIKY